MSKEPAAIVGAITAIVSAVLVFLESFGVSLTDDQQAAIRGIVAVVAPLIAAVVIRNFVVSPASAGEAVAIAKTIDPASATVPDVSVSGYRAAVVEALPGVTAQSQVNWQPKVANA